MDFFVNLRKKLLMDTNDKCILRAVGISENPEAGGLLKKKVLPILRSKLDEGGTVCSNGFYANISNQHQMQQY